MLRARLSRFVAELPVAPKSKQEITRVILLYLIGRQNANDLREVGRTLGITKDLYDFKSTYLDRNYYTVSQFWRIAFGYFARVPAKTADGPSTTKVHQDSLDEALRAIPTLDRRQYPGAQDDFTLIEQLTIADHRFLYRLARAVRYETPTDLDLLPLIKQLQKFCRTIAYQKVRFLAQNDFGLSMDDLINELFEIGLLAMRTYDWNHNQLKLLNTVKRSVRNHCVRMIEFHTAQRRARLVQMGPEFQSTTASLNQQLGDDRTTLLDLIADPCLVEEQVVDKQWLGNLLSRVPPKIQRIVSITLGGQDQEFETWLSHEKGHETEDLSDPALAQNACQFLGVPMGDVQTLLRRNMAAA